MFFRKPRIEPLLVTMSAARMGERVLQIGIDDASIASAIAAKVGLSGHAAIIVGDDRDAGRAQSASAGAGVLVDVRVASPSSLPFESDAFDLMIVHSTNGRISSLDAQTRLAATREWHRVLRRGGRVMTIEAGPATGLARVFRQQRTNDAYESSGAIIGALEAAGFRLVRLLAEREGYKFAEGTKS